MFVGHSLIHYAILNKVMVAIPKHLMYTLKGHIVKLQSPVWGGDSLRTWEQFPSYTL